MARDPRVDEYIENAAEFARPVLRHLRETVHAASPEIDETIRWGAPSFTHNGILCHMAAFKNHCAFAFWKGILLEGVTKSGTMGHLGRITAISNLPPEKTLIALLRRAMALNEEGVRVARAPVAKQGGEEPEIPESLRTALEAEPRARATFERFSASMRREYIEWISEAKQDATRKRRVATTIEWLIEGKSRTWKYRKAGG